MAAARKQLGEVKMILRKAADGQYEATGVNCAAVGVGKTKVEALQDFVECMAALIAAGEKHGSTMYFEPTADDIKLFRLARRGAAPPDIVGSGVFSVAVMRGAKSRVKAAPMIEAEELALV